MQDGVARELHRRDARAVPRRCGHATGNAGLSFVDPAQLQRGTSRALDAAGLPGARPRDRRPGGRARRSTRSRPRRRPRPTAAPHRAPPGRRTPTTCRGSPSSASTANMQALWACHDAADGRADDPVPRRRAGRAGSTPSATCTAAGARLVVGSDWPVSHARPAARRSTSRSTAHGVRRRRPAEPFLPEQALDLATALAAYTAGSAWVNHRDDSTRA